MGLDLVVVVVMVVVYESKRKETRVVAYDCCLGGLGAAGGRAAGLVLEGCSVAEVFRGGEEEG